MVVESPRVFHVITAADALFFSLLFPGGFFLVYNIMI